MFEIGDRLRFKGTCSETVIVLEVNKAENTVRIIWPGHEHLQGWWSMNELERDPGYPFNSRE